MTNWDHDRVCRHCLKSSTHKEFMTNICLGCGTNESSIFKYVAIRKIVKDGVWVEQMRLEDEVIFNRVRNNKPLT